MRRYLYKQSNILKVNQRLINNSTYFEIKLYSRIIWNTVYKVHLCSTRGLWFNLSLTKIVYHQNDDVIFYLSLEMLLLVYFCDFKHFHAQG